MQEGVFDVYTDVAAHVKWINDTILSMGGMQSCGYTLEKILSEEKDGDYAVDNDDDGYDDDVSVDHCGDDDDDKGDVDDANQANSQSPYSHYL